MPCFFTAVQNKRISLTGFQLQIYEVLGMIHDIDVSWITKNLCLADSLHLRAASRTCCFSMLCATAHTVVIYRVTRKRRWQRAKHSHSWAHFVHLSKSPVIPRKKYSYNNNPRIWKWNKHCYCYAYTYRNDNPHYALGKKISIFHSLIW